MFKKILKDKNRIFLMILVIASVLFTVILFYKGLLRGHDIEFHLSRIEGLRDSIKSGDLVALIHSGLYGYGYANGIFYGNLFIYLPAILSLLGLSLAKSYVVFITVCNILTAVIAYYVVKRISKSNTAAFIASLLYLFSPYRICDVVVRAAIGEVLAMMIIPIVILGLYEIIYGDHKKWWIFSIGFVLLVQAHIISTIIMAIISLVILLININEFIKNKAKIKYLIYSVILGVLVGAYFMFPLLEQYTFSELVVNNLKSDVDLGVNAIKLERIFLGLSYYSSGVFHPPGVGLIFILASLFRYKLNTQKKELLKITDLFLIIGLVSLLLVTPFFPWTELSEYLKFIQFPWRLYLFATVFLSLSSALIIYLRFGDKIKVLVYMGIYLMISFIVGISFNFNAIHNYWGVAGMEYISGYNDYYVANGEYLPYKTDVYKLRDRGEQITSNNQDINIEYTKIGNRINIKYNNNYMNDTYIELPLLYYLGYGTNKDYKIEAGENNVIRVYLDKEKDSFEVSYRWTLIQKLSYLISFITIAIGLIYIIIKKRKKIRK